MHSELFNNTATLCVQDFTLSYLVWPSQAFQQVRGRYIQSGELHRGSFIHCAKWENKKKILSWIDVWCDFIWADLCKHFQM